MLATDFDAELRDALESMPRETVISQGQHLYTVIATYMETLRLALRVEQWPVRPQVPHPAIRLSARPSHLSEAQQARLDGILREAKEYHASLLRRHGISAGDLILPLRGLGGADPVVGSGISLLGRIMGKVGVEAWVIVADLEGPVGQAASPSTCPIIPPLIRWLKRSPVWPNELAEMILRGLHDFFRDHLGHFHPDTVSLQRTLVQGMMDRGRFAEAAAGFRTLADVFEAIIGEGCHEVCAALCSSSLALLQCDLLPESWREVSNAIGRWRVLAPVDAHLIAIRCLDVFRELSQKLGRYEEARRTLKLVTSTIDGIKKSPQLPKSRRANT
ncbi:uncharacterized protein A1O9_13141 [Exophiala aquamarina CBS 119918]|uniref:Uncharacterized protein n=1 Tax=Exophiala aquamarina CBS 119918 TaxID=1182545 RepID=A0A072NTX0_9EURO|nr:uncharacterized protein A1O9_13141 [Exophiala aquamarina CBS 119918]KEF50807.1 hypothetical protein A1O9_13141 [Exophiala aquamarina CBS 119918]